MTTLTITHEDSVGEVIVEKIYNCYDCLDTREVADYFNDSDSHEIYWDGNKPCHCTL